MSNYPDVTDVINREATDFYFKYGKPPRFAYVMPQVYRAIQLESMLDVINPVFGMGFQVLQVVTDVGAITIKSDNTIDTPDIAFVTDNENIKYIDYITEKTILGE